MARAISTAAAGFRGFRCGLLLAAGLALAAAFGGPAVSAEPTSENNDLLKRALERFPQADLNGDGVLTADEARQAREQLLKKKGGKSGAAAPDMADVKYGPHERNVLDFWKAKSDSPTPLVVFIHGGGFVSGDKSKADPQMIRDCLAAGVSFMSINYRFREHAPIQDILRDAARAVQFVRSRAEEFHIDPKRIASYGGSAGAGTSLWLAVHDDLADPQNADPVLRQSSRIVAAGCLNGQATYNLLEWETLIGPFKPEWMRSPNEKTEFYRFKDEADFQTPEGKKILADCSMVSLISGDDPPVFMSCSVPDVEPKDRGQYVHHPRHVQAVKKACDAKGVTCVVQLKGDGKSSADESGPVRPAGGLKEFFFKYLSVTQPVPAKS